MQFTLRALIVLLAVGATTANNCTSWHNCVGDCPFGTWSDTTIASIGRWASFNDNMDKAMDIMLKYPGVTSLDRGIVHLSLQYLCCYDIVQYSRYIDVISNYKWHSVNITFGKAVCNMDEGDPDHTSFIVLVDDKSQAALASLVKGFEAAMINAGIPVSQPRATMELFHSTIGVVNKHYDADAVINEINKAIPTFSPIPINLSNFLLIPVPLWEFFSDDSRSTGSSNAAAAEHASDTDGQTALLSGSPAQRAGGASTRAYGRAVPKSRLDADPDFQRLVQRYRSRHSWVPE